MFTHWWVITICLVASVYARVGEAELTLVESGQPRAVIVVSAGASDQAREAALALQGYLERMSGAKLEIREDADAGQTRIFVGASQAVRDLGIEVPSGFSYQMNEEGFVIKTIENGLVLVGNEHSFYRGTVYAVYEFLERLGCRWFFPGPYGEVVPKLETIRVGELNIEARPDFRFRNIWYSGWMPVRDEDSKNYAAWLDHNKMNSLAKLSLPGDGSIIRLAPAETYFVSHPHIYAVNTKGEREKDMLCLSEPEAVKISVQTILEEFRAHPDVMTFGFAPPDGHPMCHCDRCEAANPGFRGKGYGEPSLSDVWFRFANAVAVEVYKEFPERWLLTNGYANRVRPPEGVGPLSPNLGIQSAMIDSCTFHLIGDKKCWQRQLYKGVLDRWTNELRCVFVYDYDPGKSLDGLPFPALHNLMHDFPYFKERGIWGFWTEGHNSWMVTHLNYYVRAKLMWDAESDVRALVRDYCEKFYGDAARPVEEYTWTLEDAVNDTAIHETWGRLVPWRVILTPKVVRALEDTLSEARRRATAEPEATHVRVLDLTHQLMSAHLDMEQAAARGDFVAAATRPDAMLRIRDEAAKIDPALLPHTPEWCRYSDGSVEWYKKTYQDLADRINGVRGELIAMTPVRWEFRSDPESIGEIYRWYAPDAPGSWEEIDSTLYWEAQGYQDERGYGYTGHAWYRTQFQAPESAAGKPLRLTIGGVYSDKIWIWVNGKLIDHRTKQNTRVPFDLDVTSYLHPGERNSITLLIETLPPDRNARAGLHRRVFVWSPNEGG
ncbi:MAG: DUF4838 domain-containing protein [Candidatus Hydrogenedentes bacterium]|nr:DUF4838 domain-containing protein [Candidatus Hydrogenedentota bacterium]